MNSIFELWSQIMPERALACSFNLEYLLVGGRDARRPSSRIFMWYDWMVGGWGGRNGKDGSNATAPIFGVGLAVQPLEGQERLSPGRSRRSHAIRTDSGGPGPVPRRLRRREGRHADRGRAHRHVVLLRPGALDRLGDRGRAAVATARRLAQPGRRRTSASSAPSSPTCRSRPATTSPGPSAGGGGYGDPLERDPAAGASRTSPTATSRSSGPRWTTASSCGDRRRARRVRARRRGDRGTAGEIRAERRGWLAEDAATSRAATGPASSTCSTWSATTASSSTGARASCRAHDSRVPGDAGAPGGGVVEV